MIFVSAGHNKNKQGASYSNNGYELTEFMISTKWADLITHILDDKASRVPNGTLTNKVKFINNFAEKDSIAIEIHFNSYKKWKDLNGDGVVDAGEMIALGRGSETLYMPNSKAGKDAALTVQANLGHLMKPDRGIKEGWYQMNPSKGADYFLRETDCTALIIEPEFIDNVEEINQNMNAACHVIANALLEIYNA